MAPLEQRIEQAESLWASGMQAEIALDYALAYQRYTEAHDAIMDCAKLHQYAHIRLGHVNLQLGNYGELLGDWFLNLFAPLGVFELVAYFSKTEGFASAVCKR